MQRILHCKFLSSNNSHEIMKRKSINLKEKEISSGKCGNEEDVSSGFEDSFENEEVAVPRTVATPKRTKLSKKELLKPPTNEELNQLRETENLFHSNLFRLQIEEMFNEVKIKERHVVTFQEWFKNISAFLDDLENLKAKEMPCRKWLKKLDVKMPLKQQTAEVNGVFLFAKPAAVKLIGSYANGCCVGPNIRADVLIQMPRKCFHRGDPLNYKYFHKRALYLSYLSAKLKESDLVEEVKFAHGHGIAIRPVLIVKPSGKLAKHFTVVMNLAPPPKCFKHHIFSPLKNNVRENWYLGRGDGEEMETGSPTPHYNSSILMDLTVHENEEIRSNALSENQNLKDGIKLLKIWLHQRELDEGYGSFSAYIMSMYVVYLMQERRISNLMSSYQVVRTVWNCLAASDWTTKGISLAVALKNKEWIPLDNYHQNFEVVFVDVTGFYNLCATMTKSTFMRVKHESQLAVKCLDNPNLNSFQALFMTKVQFYQQFDHIITFYNPSTLEKCVQKHGKKEDQLDYGNHILPVASRIILNKLCRATERRAMLVSEKLCPSLQWEISDDPPDTLQAIVMGLTLDPEHAFELLEKGPPANSVEAQEFRKFWGNKSELRRFQDGSVCEAVLWGESDTPMSKRRMVCHLAIEHILKTIGLEEGLSWQYFANQMESVIHRFRQKHASTEEETLAIIRATDSLSSNLRQLKGMPLDITSVIGLSPAQRYADPFSPVAQPWLFNICTEDEKKKIEHEKFYVLNGPKGYAPKWTPHVEVITQLSISSKWPSSLEAIRRVKAAFHLKIAESLKQQCKLVAQPYTDYLDVLQDGFIIRVHLACPKEISLHKESKEMDGMVKYRDTEDSLALEKKIIHLPKLSSALHGLQQINGAYGATCCLAKRWVASQLLLSNSHLPEVCVELLVASLFLQPEPLAAPNQPQTAFLRFLHLMASRDWSSQPLILNFNDELTRQDILSIENKFNVSERSSLPPLVIATPYDHAGIIWTKESPSVQILVRLAHLASTALQVVETKVYQRTILNFKQIFRPSLEPYDLILHLNHKMVPRSKQSVDPHLLKYEEGEELNIKPILAKGILPVISYDPVEIYLQELQESFSEFALFFYDCYGGKYIGVLWKPAAYEEKDVKVSHLNGRKLDPSTNKLVTNFNAIIEDFHVIGKGLVSHITVKEKKER